MGGSGRNGGGGGRVGIVYNITSYTGEFRSKGGVGTQGENGAAGTVYLNNIQSQPERKLVIYNQGGSGVRVRGIPDVWGDILGLSSVFCFFFKNNCHQYNSTCLCYPKLYEFYITGKGLYLYNQIIYVFYVFTYESLLFIIVSCICLRKSFLFKKLLQQTKTDRFSAFSFIAK